MVFFHVVLIEEVCINILSKLNTLTRAPDKGILGELARENIFILILKKIYKYLVLS